MCREFGISNTRRREGMAPVPSGHDVRLSRGMRGFNSLWDRHPSN